MQRHARAIHQRMACTSKPASRRSARRFTTCSSLSRLNASSASRMHRISPWLTGYAEFKADAWPPLACRTKHEKPKRFDLPFVDRHRYVSEPYDVHHAGQCQDRQTLLCIETAE